jgi:hypothetical protein
LNKNELIYDINLYNNGVLFNYFTLSSLLLLYIFEIFREYILYNELRFNSGNNHIDIFFDKTPLKKIIIINNFIHKFILIFSSICYIINIIFSAIIINKCFIINNNIIFLFIVFTSFYIFDVIKLFIITYSNQMYSSFLSYPLKFNDINEKYNNEIENLKETVMTHCNITSKL